MTRFILWKSCGEECFGESEGWVLLPVPHRIGRARVPILWVVTIVPTRLGGSHRSQGGSVCEALLDRAVRLHSRGRVRLIRPLSWLESFGRLAD